MTESKLIEKHVDLLIGYLQDHDCTTYKQLDELSKAYCHALYFGAEAVIKEEVPNDFYGCSLCRTYRRIQSIFG
jgi:hypothetical protein